MENEIVREDKPSSPPSHARNLLPPEARFIMFKSNIAEVFSERRNVYYIESGATQNLFNDKMLFNDLQEISP